MPVWLMHSFSNLVELSRVVSNIVVGTTNHKPTVSSAVHFSEVGKWVLRSSSEDISTGHILKTANLKLKCLIQYKDLSLF